jgi:hypothetical protein
MQKVAKQGNLRNLVVGGNLNLEARTWKLASWPGGK